MISVAFNPANLRSYPQLQPPKFAPRPEQTAPDLSGKSPTKVLLDGLGTGTKLDQGKPPLSLVDRVWLEGVATTLAFGAQKYDEHNWRKGFKHTRLADAALRHIHAWVSGEDLEPESGLPHLHHASCCLMFLSNLAVTRPDLDNRYKVVQP